MPATPRPDPESPSEPSPRRFPLPRKRVVRSRRIFDSAFGNAPGVRRLNGRSLTLLVLPRPDGEAGEVAFLTPKRLGKANVRNKLRRRLREAYRLNFPADAARRVIWLAKTAALALDFGQLTTQMKELHARSLGPQ